MNKVHIPFMNLLLKNPQKAMYCHLDIYILFPSNRFNDHVQYEERRTITSVLLQLLNSLYIFCITKSYQYTSLWLIILFKGQ